jgi:hypothetical protein
MDPSSLVQRLVTEFGYAEKGANLVANKLAASKPFVREAFLNYWEHGVIPDLEVEGFTCAILMNLHGMNVIAAILTLDWLAREPEKAKTSLKKGHDEIFVQRR